MTIHARVAAARHRLREAGVAPEEADLDARLLAEYALGWDAARLLAAGSEGEPPNFAEAYDRLVERRSRREPVAYIVGRQEFWGLSFETSPAVLIPRPESELIIETALELLGPRARVPLSVADVGTGSGCLAVALASCWPNAQIVATDISEAALEVAARNALRHGVADRMRFVRTDLLVAADGSFDVIVANPPYVPERDRAGLQPEVRDYEPAAALFAGDDGLAVIRRLLQEAPDRLADGGLLIFEIGFGQADAVAGLISRTPRLTMVGLRRDLQDIPRTAVARRV